jgi:hypothetical protein
MIIERDGYERVVGDGVRVGARNRGSLCLVPFVELRMTIKLINPTSRVVGRITHRGVLKIRCVEGLKSKAEKRIRDVLNSVWPGYIYSRCATNADR